MGKIGIISGFVIGSAIDGAVIAAISAPILSYMYLWELFSATHTSEAQGWTLLAFIIAFIPSIVIGAINNWNSPWGNCWSNNWIYFYANPTQTSRLG